MRNSPGLLVLQGMALGVTLAVDVVVWRWALTGPRRFAGGPVAAAILILIIALIIAIIMLINLLMP